jgi:SAM-dependent methyltransferase
MITCAFPQDLSLVNRDDYIVSLCRAKRVLHLGCTDSPVYETQLQANRLLHLKIMAVAEYILGVDIDDKALQWFRSSFGGEYMLADLEDGSWVELVDGQYFDIILLPDVLEHVNNQFSVLMNIRKVAAPGAKLLVSVPNTYSVKGMARAVFCYERIHPSHVAFHSFYTLNTILSRSGWESSEFFSYLGGGKGPAASLANIVLKRMPWLAEGIGVLADPA